jgi:hypothetical protein
MLYRVITDTILYIEVSVPSQESERSCIGTDTILYIEVSVPSQESERSCIGTYTILYIEVSVPSQESERSCICTLGVSRLPLSTIVLLDSGNVPTVWCFLVFYFVR